MDPVLWTVVVLVVAGGAGGWFLVRRRRAPVEEAVCYYKCSCGRRLRYTPRQAGHKAACPQCKKPFTYPPAGRTTS